MEENGGKLLLTVLFSVKGVCLLYNKYTHFPVWRINIGQKGATQLTLFNHLALLFIISYSEALFQ